MKVFEWLYNRKAPTESSNLGQGVPVMTTKEIKRAIRHAFYDKDTARLWFTVELVGHSFYNVFVERLQKHHGSAVGYVAGHVLATVVLIILVLLFSGGIVGMVEALGVPRFVLMVAAAIVAVASYRLLKKDDPKG